MKLNPILADEPVDFGLRCTGLVTVKLGFVDGLKLSRKSDINSGHNQLNRNHR